MGLTETLSYKVKDIRADSLTQKSVSLELNVAKNKSKYLIHRAIVVQDNKKRQGTACTKTRSEVRAGGKKPWKQKGTGQARSGSKNSPLWNGGGVTFGPKPRSYKKKINSKEWKLAIRTALFKCSKKLIVVEDFADVVKKPSTQFLLEKLQNVISLNERTLVVIERPNQNINLSLRNVANLKLSLSNALNVKDVLMAKNIIVTEDALHNIQQTYHA